MDSCGFGELFRANTAAKDAGGNLKLLGLTRKIHDMLRITKTYNVIGAFENEEDALKSFAVSPTYCLCPVCQHPSQPSLVDKWIEWWPTQLCGNCLSRFEARFCPDSREQAQVQSLCLPTYENECLQILPGTPFTLQIVGRLDLFSSSALEKAWHSLPAPRKVLFDLRQATEISDAGRSALLTLLANSEEEARATISVEDLGQEQMKAFPIEPPVYTERAAALAALGNVSDTPAWTIRVVTP
jgi:anti-anti-sigma regulatory factor